MFFRHCSRHVNDRQQHEYISLKNSDDDMKPAEKNRNPDRDHGKKDKRDQITGKNVRSQTYGQREQPCKMADQLNREHERGEQNTCN